MERPGHRIPMAVTVSRKTGEVTHIQWCEAGTDDEFQNVVDWMIKAGRSAIRCMATEEMKGSEDTSLRTTSPDVLHAAG